jgi:hypothetical protein
MQAILQLIMTAARARPCPFGGSIPKYLRFKVDDPEVAEQDRKEGGNLRWSKQSR